MSKKNKNTGKIELTVRVGNKELSEIVFKQIKALTASDLVVTQASTR